MSYNGIVDLSPEINLTFCISSKLTLSIWIFKTSCYLAFLSKTWLKPNAHNINMIQHPEMRQGSAKAALLIHHKTNCQPISMYMSPYKYPNIQIPAARVDEINFGSIYISHNSNISRHSLLRIKQQILHPFLLFVDFNDHNSRWKSHCTIFMGMAV